VQTRRQAFRKYVGCIGKTETYIVVAVIWRVVVAISYTHVGRVVVPRTAANNTVGASCPLYLWGDKKISVHFATGLDE